MHALTLATLLCAQPDETGVSVESDSISISDAERLEGKLVVTTFTVAAPAFTWGEGKSLRTVTGPASQDGTERTVILKGNRLRDADRGARVTVVGTLRVIHHAPSAVGTMPLGEWTELRIKEN